MPVNALMQPRIDGTMQATPRNALMGYIADALSAANSYANKPDRSMPMGKANPVLGLLSSALGVGDLAATADNLSYGRNLTQGQGMARQMLPETANALMTMGPVAAKFPRQVAAGAAGLMSGDMNAARAMITPMKPKLNTQAAIESYGMDHRPMTEAGGAARLHDLVPVFGEDVYGPKALQYFGSGDARERQALQVMKMARGNPDAMVTVYRGVPDDVSAINSGDWVTLSPQAAADYGKVLSMKVPASHVTSWPDSLLEFGYFPPTK